MSDLFLVLLLISIVALIVGLKNPKLVIRWGEEEKRTRKKAIWTYGVAVVILFIAFGISMPNNQGSQQTTAPAASAPAQSPVATPSWNQIAVSQNTVIAQLKEFKASNILPDDNGFPADITKTTVSDGTIQIEYKPAEGLDETMLVKEAIGTDLDSMKMLFQNKQVAKVDMITMVDMADQYGNTSASKGVELVYDRSTADKIDWTGFENRALTDPANALNLSNSYFIHPGIYKNLKIDNLDNSIGGTDSNNS